jgi:hypothetical protein
MKLSIARFISFLFNPLSITIFAPFVLLYRTTGDFDKAIYWTVYTTIFIAFLGVFAIIGVKKKVFTDLDVSKREQRPLMFLVSVLFATSYLGSLFLFQGPYILYILSISAILGICFVSVINRYIKASIHVAALTALILPIAVSYQGYYVMLLLLIPLVSWSRLATKRHSLSEIFVGGILGSLLSLSIYLAVKFFFPYD